MYKIDLSVKYLAIIGHWHKKKCFKLVAIKLGCMLESFGEL